MKNLKLFGMLVGFALLFVSCNDKELILPEDTSVAVENLPETCVEPTQYELIAGQSILSGYLYVSNDQENLYVAFKAINDFSIAETHLYVGDKTLVPKNNAGTPVPGQFPYKDEFSASVDYHYYTIPLSELESCFSIFAHATMKNASGAETAWSNSDGGTFIDGDKNSAWTDGTSFYELTGTNRWGGYSNYCIMECNENPKEDCYNDETAWSFGTSFESLTGTNRWGWFSEYSLGNTTNYKIYAGQHIEVGNMNVSNDEENLTINIVFDGGNKFDYGHFYIGGMEGTSSLMNKSGTPVPGKFPIHVDEENNTSHTLVFPISELNTQSTIIIGAHFEAKVKCEYY